MFDCHVNAFLVQPGEVLGKKLQHFCLGHAYLLDAAESPFLKGGKWTDGDLFYAVKICSLSFPEAIKFVQLASGIVDIKRLFRWWFFKVAALKYDINVEAHLFENYLAVYNEFLDEWKDKDPTKNKRRESAVPFSFRLAWVLMKNIPENIVWQMPMPRVLAYFAVAAEENGTEFVSEKENHVVEHEL
jgi:hypothetical protein